MSVRGVSLAAVEGVGAGEVWVGLARTRKSDAEVESDFADGERFIEKRDLDMGEAMRVWSSGNVTWSASRFDRRS